MLKEALYRYWLPKLLARRCPSVISRSGEKGEAVNCFSVAIDKSDDPYLLLEEYDEGIITASEWDAREKRGQIYFLRQAARPDPEVP